MNIGELIPEFHVPDQDCNYWSTSDLIGEPLVIYFYPKDDTPGCTKQACSFRDRYSEFEDAGAKVIGVSSDSPEDHREFQKKYRLPFTLISDKNGALRKSFGVENNLLGLKPGRETFVFDKKGKLVHRFNSQIKTTKHIREAINALNRLAES